MLDHFLRALKDSGTPLLVECQCFRNNERTGIADYFVTLHGRWVPIEAKLNVLGERDIFQQIAKYTHIDSFKPTRGDDKDKTFTTDASPICIIIDQAGIFVISDEKFVACDIRSPLFKREQLTPEFLSAIREQLASII